MKGRKEENIFIAKALREHAKEIRNTKNAAAKRLCRLAANMERLPHSHIWDVVSPSKAGTLKEIRAVLSDMVFETTYPYTAGENPDRKDINRRCYLVQGIFAKDLDGIINNKEDDHE